MILSIVKTMATQKKKLQLLEEGESEDREKKAPETPQNSGPGGARASANGQRWDPKSVLETVGLCVCRAALGGISVSEPANSRFISIHFAEFGGKNLSFICLNQQSNGDPQAFSVRRDHSGSAVGVGGSGNLGNNPL